MSLKIKDLNPKIWLEPLFFTLETIAIHYPDNPNKTTIKKYYNLINDLPVFIPEKPMGTYFESLLDKFPVQPYLNSRTSFMKWVFFIKKKIYKKLKMEIFDFYENLEIYYNAYKPKELFNYEKIQERRKYMQTIFVIMISFSIYYFYNK